MFQISILGRTETACDPSALRTSRKYADRSQREHDCLSRGWSPHPSIAVQTVGIVVKLP